VVDHIIPHKGDQQLFWNRDNWQPMAKSCHDKKTRADELALHRGEVLGSKHVGPSTEGSHPVHGGVSVNAVTPSDENCHFPDSTPVGGPKSYGLFTEDRVHNVFFTELAFTDRGCE